MPTQGEDRVWDQVAGLDPERALRTAGVDYDRQAASFLLTCFGEAVVVSPSARRVHAFTDGGQALLDRLGSGFPLLALGYLAYARDEPLAGRLINPAQLPGGDIFERGTHVLPLERLAQQYGEQRDAFLRQGRALHGVPLAYGDMAVELWPFPRLPLTLIVWAGDDEFPPRASLLFDAHSGRMLPTDILWSAASLTVHLMLS